MADGTGIEWTDATWNPITGCSVVSPGCKNCYAMKLAGGRLQNHWSRQGLTDATKVGPVWNGIVQFNHNWIDQPLRWRKPRMIFVCAHGDLFHESVPDEWIDNVFAVMALAPWHTFQVLTKRAQRMRDYLVSRNGMGNASICAAINGIPNHLGDRHGALSMPLPNVWLGVSVENQTLANERVPLLLDTPAAVRWISAEPLLGPVDLNDIQTPAVVGEEHFSALYIDVHPEDDPYRGATVDWLVVGGESGPGARPMHPDWARSLIEQCNTYDVPVLFKQWGEFDYSYDRSRDDPDWRQCDRVARAPGRWVNLEGGTGFHGDRLHYAKLVGKKAAGRVIDGRTWDQYPEPRA